MKAAIDAKRRLSEKIRNVKFRADESACGDMDGMAAFVTERINESFEQ